MVFCQQNEIRPRNVYLGQTVCQATIFAEMLFKLDLFYVSYLISFRVTIQLCITIGKDKLRTHKKVMFLLNKVFLVLACMWSETEQCESTCGVRTYIHFQLKKTSAKLATVHLHKMGALPHQIQCWQGNIRMHINTLHVNRQSKLHKDIQGNGHMVKNFPFHWLHTDVDTLNDCQPQCQSIVTLVNECMVTIWTLCSDRKWCRGPR